MGNERTPEPPDWLDFPDTKVVITVVRDPRSAAHRRVAMLAALATLAVGAIGALAMSLVSHSEHRRAVANAPGPAGVAAAYGYPIRCLAVTVAAVDRSYARADPNRASPCGRYDGTMMAIFQRVDGAWRPVLNTVNYRCPVSALPVAVQNELAVCPSPPAKR